MSKDNGDIGCSFSPSTIAVIFIVFKLTHVIDWSWWWVLSPIWIVLLLFAMCGTEED